MKKTYNVVLTYLVTLEAEDGLKDCEIADLATEEILPCCYSDAEVEEVE